jgi:hypothetical protein
LKQGDDLSPILFNFALEYAITWIQAKPEGLKLNATYHFLVYVDDVNILCGIIQPVNKNIEGLVVASKGIGIEEILRKLSIWSCLETRWQDKSQHIGNISFETVETSDI